jgi:uncharacterized protein YxeA
MKTKNIIIIGVLAAAVIGGYLYWKNRRSTGQTNILDEEDLEDKAKDVRQIRENLRYSRPIKASAGDQQITE